MNATDNDEHGKYDGFYNIVDYEKWSNLPWTAELRKKLAEKDKQIAQLEYDKDNRMDITAENDYLQRKLVEAATVIDKAKELANVFTTTDDLSQDILNEFLLMYSAFFWPWPTHPTNPTDDPMPIADKGLDFENRILHKNKPDCACRYCKLCPCPALPEENVVVRTEDIALLLCRDEDEIFVNARNHLKAAVVEREKIKL